MHRLQYAKARANGTYKSYYKPKPPRPKPKPVHGKYATYRNHKCRCEPCRSAKSKYEKERSLKKRERDNLQ